MKQVAKRLLLVILFLVLAGIVFAIVMPWFFIGSPLFAIRWILTGKTTGIGIYIFGWLLIPEIFYFIISDRLKLLDDNCFSNSTIMGELKHYYNE